MDLLYQQLSLGNDNIVFKYQYISHDDRETLTCTALERKCIRMLNILYQHKLLDMNICKKYADLGGVITMKWLISMGYTLADVYPINTIINNDIPAMQMLLDNNIIDIPLELLTKFNRVQMLQMVTDKKL